MQTLLSIPLMICSLIASAQSIIEPEYNDQGKLEFARIVKTETTADEGFSLAKKWYAENFVTDKPKLSDRESKTIIGNGSHGYSVALKCRHMLGQSKMLQSKPIQGPSQRLRQLVAFVCSACPSKRRRRSE